MAATYKTRIYRKSIYTFQKANQIILWNFIWNPYLKKLILWLQLL